MKQYQLTGSVWAVFILLEFITVCAEDLHDEVNKQLYYRDEPDTYLLARGKAKKKLKHLLPVLLAALVVKSFLIPLALKGIAVVSGKAFLLSALSLIVSSIVGLKKVAHSSWDRISHIPLRDRGDIISTTQPITEGLYQKYGDQYWGRHFPNNGKPQDESFKYNT